MRMISLWCGDMNLMLGDMSDITVIIYMYQLRGHVTKTEIMDMLFHRFNPAIHGQCTNCLTLLFMLTLSVRHFIK